MKYCEQCRVKVDNPHERCPLCYAPLGRLDEEIEYYAYPDVAGKTKGYNLILRILVMLTIAISTVCVTINLLTYQGLLWSVVVVGNLLYMWIAIGTALSKRTRIGQSFFFQVVALAALLVLIDYLTGGYNGWALDFVLPFLFLSATLSITIIIIVKRMLLREFILYFLLTVLLGFIPLILLAFGLVSVLWPSLSCALYAGFSLVGIFIFADADTKIELKKRFHI